MSSEQINLFGQCILIGYAFTIGVWVVSFSIRKLFDVFKMVSSR